MKCEDCQDTKQCSLCDGKGFEMENELLEQCILCHGEGKCPFCQRTLEDFLTGLKAGKLQLHHDHCEKDAEIRKCPECDWFMQYWYISVFTDTGWFWDTVQSWKCKRCDYEQFFYEQEENHVE